MKTSLIERFVPVLLVAVIALSFAVGVLWQKVENLNSSSGAKVAAANTNNPAAAPSPLLVDSLKQYAKGLGLDVNKFNSCLDDNKSAQKVTEDMTYGTTVGVNGTPAFFVDGYLISGAQPYDVFKKTIEFLAKGGNMAKPDSTMTTLVDGNADNGEVSKTKTAVDIGDAPVIGQDKAPITVIEFSDFECPFCESFFTNSYGQLKKDFIDTGKIKFAYKYFPLSFHPNAQKAAEAAQCAKEQGKFWEMHDKLFQVQQQS